MTLKRIISGHLQFVLALVACIATTPAAHAQAKWVRLAPFPEPAEEILGAAAGGKMYVFAGLAPVWKPMGMVWEYDPANDNWKALASLPTKRGSAVAAVVGDKIYVIGGAANLPGSEAMALMPTVPQGVLGTVEEYDPAAHTWRARSPMPTPRNHAAAGAVNGKIYVIGGRVGAAFIGVASDISVVEEYDPAMDKWSAPRARMPTTRSALGAGTYNGRIYVAGGEFQDPHMMATFRSVEAFDPATNTWSIMPSMPVSRHGLAAGVIGNRLLLVGGDVQSSGTEIHASTSEVDALELPGMDK